MREKRPRSDAVEREIARLGNLTREELIERWNNTHGRSPPKGISRRLLEFSAAYELQSRLLGGLKTASGKALVSALDPISKNPKLPNGTGSLGPGSQLVRVWNGRTHHVEVVEKGFIWNGRHFRSLSAIAREITGARWSGPRFFGL